MMTRTDQDGIGAPDARARESGGKRWKGFFVLVLCLILFDTGQADPVRRVAVADLSWVASKEARQRLGYLASCALGGDTVLYAHHGNEYVEFPGGLELAPDWLHKPLDASRRRWVSACVLARTNAFGVNVPIILAAGGPGVPTSLLPTDDRFTQAQYEGGFFGDIFADEARAFVCVPNDQPDLIEWQRASQRICSHRLPGHGTSRCGFTITGTCPDNGVPEIEGTPWPQVVHVWLPRNPD